MSTERRWTHLEVLHAAAEFLEKRTVDNARSDAEQLLSQVLGMTRLDLYLQHDRPLDPEERGAYRGLLQRRASGEPLQYILGQVDFLDLTLSVGPGVLIPRPETESLALEAEALVAGLPAARVLDVGCGSGALGLYLVRRASGVRLLALDRSPRALRFAVANAKRLELAAQVCCLKGDLAHLPVGSASVDLLVCNPPYVARPELVGLQREIREHEPRQALDGGPEGLSAYRRLVPEAARVLRPGGWLALEVGQGQAAAITELCAGLEWTETLVRRDLAGVERVVLARRQGGGS